jgi:uncharacterized protein
LEGDNRRFFGSIAGQTTGWDTAATTACVVTSVVLIVGHYQGEAHSFSTFFPHATGRFQDIYGFLWWFGASCVLFLAVPAAITAATPGIRVRQLGFGAGDWRFGLPAAALLLAVMLPVVFVASRTQTFGGNYPLCAAATKDRAHFLVYEIAYMAYFVAWEFLYRGYLLFSLERKIGNFAIVVQTMPFALLHLGKPELEALGSVVAGIALGILALRTRSFWYGALVHITVAVTMDLRAGLPKLH